MRGAWTTSVIPVLIVIAMLDGCAAKSAKDRAQEAPKPDTSKTSAVRDSTTSSPGLIPVTSPLAQHQLDSMMGSRGKKVTPGVAHPAMRALWADTSNWSGKSVILTCAYSGWSAPASAAKSVPAAPPVSRNDWLLCADSACVYVNGAVPNGWSPMNRDHLGTTISVQGTVKYGSDGKPYLQLPQ